MIFTCPRFYPFRIIVPWHQESLAGFRRLNLKLLRFLLLSFKSASLSSSRSRLGMNNDSQYTVIILLIDLSQLHEKFCMQADYIGSKMLSKLLHEWRLLDELGLLRAIYFLGAGVPLNDCSFVCHKFIRIWCPLR